MSEMKVFFWVSALYSFQVRHPCCVERITNIDKMQSDTTINICIAKRCFYMAVLMTTCFSRYIRHHQVVHSLISKANYTIYNTDKNNVYCILCFRNKRMYNLMVADIAAETCRC